MALLSSSARTGRGYLRRVLSWSRREVLVDQRVRELPLRARELDPVALDGGGRRTGGAKLLPLQNEVSDPGRENIDRSRVPAPPEA
jgi:hypothetical protein